MITGRTSLKTGVPYFKNEAGVHQEAGREAQREVGALREVGGLRVVEAEVRQGVGAILEAGAHQNGEEAHREVGVGENLHKEGDRKAELD